MTQPAALEDFISLIMRNLEKNGFPANSVSFPLERMYETASQKGFSFNKVRDILKQRGIETELTNDKVLFQKAPDPDAAFDTETMAAAAQRLFETMKPEDKARIAEMMQSMGPDELRKIQEQWEAMPASEKSRLMDQMKT